MISFEEWFEQNADTVRKEQSECIMAHAEGGIHWWDTRVNGDCLTCGMTPHETRVCPCGHDKANHCGVPEDYMPCDCNARVLYKKAMRLEFRT